MWALNDSSNSGFAGFEQRRRDFGLIERALEAGAFEFVREVPIGEGGRVLDAGCGAGKCSIAAARAGGDVTGVDPREPFLSRARAWAGNENLLIRFKPLGNARLPFSDGNFHLSMSFLWLAFAPAPGTLLAEIRRVTRAGGTVALAMWDADGFVGRVLRLAYEYSGDDGLQRALDWCRPEVVLDALGRGVAAPEPARETLSLAFQLPAAETAHIYLAHHPALAAATAGLDPEPLDHLRAELAALWREAGGGHESTEPVEASYWRLTFDN